MKTTTKGERQMSEPKNAEEIEVTFENKSGERFLLYFHDSNNWVIERINWGIDYPILFFDSIKDAEECAKLIKRSV